jgi:hypothetical protein
MPKLVETFVGGDTATAAWIFGLFGMSWALMQFIFSPLLGTRSDRFGRRPVILFSRHWPRLHPDGARADPDAALHRACDLRHHHREHPDRVCLYRRHHQA